jgi:hypothetical protein
VLLISYIIMLEIVIVFQAAVDADSKRVIDFLNDDRYMVHQVVSDQGTKFPLIIRKVTSLPCNSTQCLLTGGVDLLSIERSTW